MSRALQLLSIAESMTSGSMDEKYKVGESCSYGGKSYTISEVDGDEVTMTDAEGNVVSTKLDELDTPDESSMSEADNSKEAMQRRSREMAERIRQKNKKAPASHRANFPEGHPNAPKKKVNESRNLLMYSKLSSKEYQEAKKLAGFDASNYTWDGDDQLYIKKEQGPKNEGTAAMNKSEKLKGLSESLGKSKFVLKDPSMSGEPTLWSTDGQGAITWSNDVKEFQITPDYDSSDFFAAKTYDEALIIAKEKGLKFDLKSLQEATKHFANLSKYK